ncbi:MAG: hypothetical protein V1736_14055 [Pseudomonadota bacterium]
MNNQQEIVLPSIPANKIKELDCLMERLQHTYEKMNQAYARVAGYYERSCEGCDGNCCTSYFHHHTLAECVYLVRGLRTLGKERQKEIGDQARDFVRERERLKQEAREIKLMCPINENGLCGLYDFRPMICRLHGVPFSYRRPDMVVIRGDGCPKLAPLGRNDPARAEVDRTPLYRDMAMLEQRIRSETGFSGRVKVMIADILASNWAVDPT